MQSPLNRKNNNDIRLAKKLPTLQNGSYSFGDVRLHSGNDASNTIDIMQPIQSIRNLELWLGIYLVCCNYIVPGRRCDMQYSNMTRGQLAYEECPNQRKLHSRGCSYISLLSDWLIN
jgi:hypothetical protein